MTEPHRTPISSLPSSKFALFGGQTPADNPKVQFSLYRTGEKLYFLNQTDRTLEKITNSSAGLLKTDDEGNVAATSKFSISYDMVQPGEAVLIEEFDTFFDPDCVIVTVVDVQLNGEIESFSVAKKGGSGTKVLKKVS